MYIALSGPMGSGKTTLSRSLAAMLDYPYVPESAPATVYLPDLFLNPSRWAFETQIAFLTHKALQLRQRLGEYGSVVLDRTLGEDINVFAEYFKNVGAIDARSFSTYESIAGYFQSIIPEPDLIIYCDCSLDNLKRRISERGRQYQAMYPEGHLEDIAELYKDWINSQPSEKVCIVDTNIFDIRDRSVVQKIVEDIQFLSGRDDNRQLQLFDGAHSGSPSQLDLFGSKGYSQIDRLQIIKRVTLEQPRASAVDLGRRHRRTDARFLHYPSVYIGAPFTGLTEVRGTEQNQQSLEVGLEPLHGPLQHGPFRRMLVDLEKAFSSLGIHGFLPHRDINSWGTRNLPAEKVVELCLDYVGKADLFAAILGLSHGTHMEYGFARGLGKPCIAIHCGRIPESFLASGVKDVGRAVLSVHCATIEDIPGICWRPEVVRFLKQHVNPNL